MLTVINFTFAKSQRCNDTMIMLSFLYLTSHSPMNLTNVVLRRDLAKLACRC